MSVAFESTYLMLDHKHSISQMRDCRPLGPDALRGRRPIEHKTLLHVPPRPAPCKKNAVYFYARYVTFECAAHDAEHQKSVRRNHSISLMIIESAVEIRREKKKVLVCYAARFCVFGLSVRLSVHGLVGSSVWGRTRSCGANVYDYIYF